MEIDDAYDLLKVEGYIVANPDRFSEIESALRQICDALILKLAHSPKKVDPPDWIREIIEERGSWDQNRIAIIRAADFGFSIGTRYCMVVKGGKVFVVGHHLFRKINVWEVDEKSVRDWVDDW